MQLVPKTLPGRQRIGPAIGASFCGLWRSQWATPRTDRRTTFALTLAQTRRSVLGAFEAFFRAHERAVFGFLWRMTGDKQAAGDLTQETFLRAWQQFAKIRVYDRPDAWLLHVATRLRALNYLRFRSVASRVTSTLFAGTNPGVDDPARAVAGQGSRASSATAPQPTRARCPRAAFRHGTHVRRPGAGAWHLARRHEGDTLAGTRSLPHRLSQGGRNRWRLKRGRFVFRGLDPEMLSTWKAQGFDRDAGEKSIPEHLPLCQACQAVLADFDAMDATLLAQDAFRRPDPHLWDALEPRLAWGARGWRGLPVLVAARVAFQSSYHKRRGGGRSQELSPNAVRSALRRVPTSRPLRVLGGVAAVAIVLLIIVGFASTLRKPGAPVPLALGLAPGHAPGRPGSAPAQFSTVLHRQRRCGIFVFRVWQRRQPTEGSGLCDARRRSPLVARRGRAYRTHQYHWL